MIAIWAADVWHFLFGWASVAILVGIGAIVIAALEPPIIAALIPDLRKWAIAVAVVAFSLTTIAGKYYDDGLTEKQRQWDDALSQEAVAGNAAHSEAVATVKRDTPDRLRNDKRNRDNWKQPVSK